MSGPTPAHIFNVDELTGKEHSALETTAAEARINAPNAVVAHEVDANAEGEQYAAQQAAAHARSMGSSLTGEPNTAATSASNITNAAVREGKHDVEEAKAVGAGYVQQVKNVMNSAVEMAQEYLPAPVTSAASSMTNAASSAVANPGETAINVATAISNTIANTAAAAVETAKETASGAHASADNAALRAQATVDEVSTSAQASANDAAARARVTANNAADIMNQSVQPHIDKAMETAQTYANAAGTQGKQLHDQYFTGSTTGPASTKAPVSATTAPLESGKHTVDTPYPNASTKPGLAEKVANPNSKEPTLAGTGAPTMLN